MGSARTGRKVTPPANPIWVYQCGHVTEAGGWARPNVGGGAEGAPGEQGEHDLDTARDPCHKHTHRQMYALEAFILHR